MASSSISQILGTATPPQQQVENQAQVMAAEVVAQQTTFTLVAQSATTELNTTEGNQFSHPSALGFFTDAPSRDEELPDENQDPGIPQHPTTLIYTGDIGTKVIGDDELVFTSGICLCTGVLGDNDPLVGGLPSGLGVGVEGPNNGIGGTPSETSFDFGALASPATRRFDLDFELFAGILNLPFDSGDAAALTFQVQVYERGLLEFTFVYGSDEYPVQVEQIFNDTFVLLVRDAAGATTNLATLNVNGTEEVFNLVRVVTCPPQIFRRNQTPPFPSDPLGNSPSRIFVENEQGQFVPLDEYYDHEFAGFTAPLRRELLVEPGTYTIKVVIEDVADRLWDSALFIPTDGIRLNTAVMQPGDFNGSGLVEQGDLDLVLGNWGAPAFPPPAGWIQDAPEGSLVDQGELDKVLGMWGKQQVFWESDVNRDGQVTQEDGDIIADNQGIQSCASIFEGDTDGDGDVDQDDLDKWQMEFNQGQAGTFDLVLRAAALSQYPTGPAPGEPLPGFVPQQPPMPPATAPTPAASPFATAPAPASVATSAPAPASEPQAAGAPEGASTETNGSTPDTSSPSLEEMLSSPNPDASDHPRYEHIAEILAIAYDYYTGDRQRDAELIWLGVARVFGEEVLPEVIQITK